MHTNVPDTEETLPAVLVDKSTSKGLVTITLTPGTVSWPI